MRTPKPFLILQLRPEDDTSNNEYEAILRYGELDAQDTHRIRIEKTGIPEISLDDYAAVIVGGSPFDISTPRREKSAANSRGKRPHAHKIHQARAAPQRPGTAFRDTGRAVARRGRTRTDV